MKKYLVHKSWWWKQQFLFLSEGLAVWRLSRNQFKPVLAETVQNYLARKLELLSSQSMYIGQQCGIWKIMGKAIFFVKGSLLTSVPVKALEAAEAGQKLQFFKYMSTIFLFGKTKFFEIFFHHNTIPVGFYWILTYIWSISLCKIAQLQESEMRPTGWTL